MPLPGAINDSHPAMPDLFENLIITQPPIGIADIDFSQHVFQRFTIGSISSQTSIEQTIQTKTASNARCRSTFWAGGRFLPESCPSRSAGGGHGDVVKM